MHRRAEHYAEAVRRWPHLAGQPFEPIGDGWTCDTYAAGDGWIVQFPRNEDAATALRKQIDTLPRLAPRLPVAIPLPDRASGGTHPIMAYRRLQGVPATERLDGGWPEQLGRALKALHGAPPAEVGLPATAVATMRRERAEQLGDFARRVSPLLAPAERVAAEELFASFDEDQRWQFAPTLVHGDIGSQHLLVSAIGDLAGIIDWEGLEAGDPAADFAWLLHRLPGHGLRALAAYGGAPDAAFLRRCRELFVLMPFHDVVYGLDTAQSEYVDSGIAGIRRRMAPSATAPSTHVT